MIKRLVLVALLVVGCKGGGATAAPAAAVPWSDYAPSLQGSIDALTAAKNCPELQAQFDNADANNKATLSRTGHNNADLMGYIDAAMKKAGCY